MGCASSSDRDKAYALKTEHDLQYKPELGVEIKYGLSTYVVAVDVTPAAAGRSTRLQAHGSRRAASRRAAANRYIATGA